MQSFGLPAAGKLLAVALAVLGVGGQALGVATTKQARSSDVSCQQVAKYNFSTVSILNQAIQGCRAGDGKVIVPNGTFYWMLPAIDHKTLIFNFNNTCSEGLLAIEKTQCEEMLDLIATDCQDYAGDFTQGTASDGCYAYGLEVLGPNNNARRSIARRQNGALCEAGSNSAPTSDVYKNIQSICITMDGFTIKAGSQESSISRVSTGDLDITFINIAGQDATIDKNTCIYDLNVLISSCSAIDDKFSHGQLAQGSFIYSSEVLPNNGGLNTRDITNSTGCFPGNASAPVSEITDIVQNSLCKFFTNATLVPKESYMFDYRIPEGDLVFKMKNVCEQNVKLDSETCYCGFDRVVQQCVSSDDRFVNGTIDNECIRLNTWVNATRLQEVDPNASTITPNATQAAVFKPRHRRDDTFNCPAGVKTPYAQDPRVDASGAVFSFCAQYDGAVMNANIQFTHDIPLATISSEGPASFQFTNKCNKPVTFDANQCEQGLLSFIDSTYLACTFIGGSTTTGDGCQESSYTVGI